MANQPSIIPSAWAANNSTTETIPATTSESGKASWDQGFPVETSLPLSEGGIPPKYGDFNGILNVLSQFALFAQSGGQYAWSNTLDYGVGSIVLGTDGSIYRAAQVSGPSTTAVNPVGDTSGKWERIVSKSDIDALEEDISDAMSTASDAASNASAAQSAVTTLDANVVKLSGNQTVGGSKTFTDGIIAATGDILKRNGDSAWIRINGGSTSTKGAALTLYGKDATTHAGRFFLQANDGSNAPTLVGYPDGTLQWDGKAVITDGGNQDVGGVKTFTSEPVVYGTTPNIAFKSSDLVRASNPSGNRYVYPIKYVDKNGDFLGFFEFLVGSGGNRRVGISTYKQDGTVSQLRLGFDTGGTPYITWDDKAIINGSDNQTVGGTKTFTSSIIAGTGNFLIRDVDTSWMRLNGGTDNKKGASVLLYGKSYSTAPGVFYVQASDGTDTVALIGKPDGSLAWNGQPVQTTSDERKKTTLADVPDDVLDAWGDVGWGQFQYLDAVEAKGAGKARLHLGLIAQRVKAVFEERGLDACKYGILCHEERPATEDEQAVDLWMVRYTEALCMEAAYQRRRADRAETRITALERRLDEMEAVLASLISPVGDETYAAPEQNADAEQEGEE